MSSVSGVCGQALQFPAVAAVPAAPSGNPGNLYFAFCAGSANGPYELDVAANRIYSGTFTDLSASGSQTALSGTAAASAIVRSGAQWTLAPLTATISAGGIVSAASYTNGIAPGGLVSIYGTGLATPGLSTSIQVNGESAPVLAAYPFQVNAQIPADIPSGSATVMVSSGIGTAQQVIAISDVAPAIFLISTGAAITNQNNSINSASNPALRGSTIVIYCTGLGAVSAKGSLNVANAPVSVVIGGVDIAAAFAGLTPGFTGVYQVNVAIPSGLPPGFSLPLYLKQGGTASNIVTVAIQ